MFCVEQGVPEHEELDGRDHEGIHLVAVADGELVGTCRLLMVGTTAQFSRLAVRASARRQRDRDGAARGGRRRDPRRRRPRLVLHAQTYAQELYEHAGYRTRGRVFREAGIEHVAMEKHLYGAARRSDAILRALL